jgi:RNA polymerase sigma-70 factor (ECF subfamily)
MSVAYAVPNQRYGTSSTGEALVVALVDRAREGDAEAFGDLFELYRPTVLRYTYGRVGSRTLAEDLTSETFVRALRGIRSFTWRGRDFGAWLTTIARNLVLDHYKASRTRLEISTDSMGAHDTVTPSPEGAVLAALAGRDLLDALSVLPQAQRECLVLRFLQDQSIAETAEALERTEGAVKQLQHRALRTLATLVHHPEG